MREFSDIFVSSHAALLQHYYSTPPSSPLMVVFLLVVDDPTIRQSTWEGIIITIAHS